MWFDCKVCKHFYQRKEIRIFFQSSLSLCCWPKSIMLGKNPANSSAISAAPGPRPCQMEVLHCRGGLWASVVSSYIWFMAKVPKSPPKPLFSSIPALRSSKIKRWIVLIYIYLSIVTNIIYNTFKNDTFKSVIFRYSWKWLLGSFWHFWRKFWLLHFPKMTLLKVSE